MKRYDKNDRRGKKYFKLPFAGKRYGHRSHISGSSRGAKFTDNVLDYLIYELEAFNRKIKNYKKRVKVE